MATNPRAVPLLENPFRSIQGRLTLEEFAKRSGIATSTHCRYVARGAENPATPTVDLLERYSNFVGGSRTPGEILDDWVNWRDRR